MLTKDEKEDIGRIIAAGPANRNRGERYAH
jgi:hypothetical protein